MCIPVKACQGYDKVLDAARNTAMRSNGSVNVGSATEMHYKMCQSMEEVASTLQIDNTLSLRFLSLSPSSYSHKLHFFNNLKLTTHSLAIVVYAKVIRGGPTITDASLAVAAPENEEEVEEFVMKYGDSYIMNVVTGAEYYACFMYYATTREQKMDLMACMQSEGLLAWDSSIDKKITKFNSSRDVQMEFHQAVRGMADVALPAPCNMLDFVLKFPTLPINMPQILSFESVGYEHAPGLNTALFLNIRRNRSLIIEDPHFLSLISQVKALENDVQAVEAMLSRYGMYKGLAGEFLDEVKGGLKYDKATLQSMMQAYRDNGRTQEVSRPLNFKSLNYEKRVQSSHWTEEKTLYTGGTGGGERDYVTNLREFVSAGRKIVSIQLRAGNIIDRINITYNNGDVVGWGGTHTRQSNILYVPEGVYFSKIRIKDNGKLLTYLEFVLTNGNSLSAGNVNSKSKHDITYEPYSPPHYLYFCGFQARSGISIDGVRPIFAKFVI